MRYALSYNIVITAAVLGICSSATAQITPQTIAARISADTNAPADQYRNYSENLAKTLSFLTPAQLVEVLGENSVVLPSLNEQLDLKPISFASGSPELSDSSLAELDSVAEFLVSNPDVNVEIEGHTGLDLGERTQKLSEDRANAALAYLTSLGIDPSRIETVGYGGSEPLIERHKETDNLEANRRIEINLK